MVGGIIEVLVLFHNQFMRLMPHIALDQQIEFIGKFKHLKEFQQKQASMDIINTTETSGIIQ